MVLTAEGTSEPLVHTDDIRLDVALWPLLSHQLSVKQVMLKGVVIRLTPQTEAVRGRDAPVAPEDSMLPDLAEDEGWSFSITRLWVTDSVLMFQHKDDEQITIRDIRLEVEQDGQHHDTFDFSGRMNRDQRDFALSSNGTADTSDCPRNLSANIVQLSWQLQGAGLPPQEINGQGHLQAQWLEEKEQLSFSQINLTANDSSFSGQAHVALLEKPEWAVDLEFGQLGLSNLLVQHGTAAAANGDAQQSQSQPTLVRPAIASQVDVASYQGLKGFSADIALQADRVQWRKMAFESVSAKIDSRFGLLNIAQLQGKSNGGLISLPGTLDARRGEPRAVFHLRLEGVEVGTIPKAFDHPIALTGRLSLTGDFSGSDIGARALRHNQ